jgi:hypothetical protein
VHGEGTMHTVLEPSVVIEGLPVNVECLTSWGDRLIVGCAEGAFLGGGGGASRVAVRW